jgi:di/tricarboxylate transporter
VLVIPATSARAAVTLPVVESMAAGSSAEFSKTIRIVVPVVVLTSAGASLLGAGAHIIAVELLQQSAGSSVNFLQWIVWCAPYALVATLLSVMVVKHRFLPKAERSRPLEPAPSAATSAITGQQVSVAIILILLVAGWIAGSLIGIDIAIPAVIGAAALMLPPARAITPGQAIKAIPWELVIFLCASLILANIFVASGSACYVVGPLIGGCQAYSATPWVVVVLVILISLFAHLIIHSRSARAAVLVPLILPLAATTDLNPVSLVLASSLAAGYCLTLPVCAKPLLMYAGDDSFDRKDLLQLSVWLLPMNAILLSLTAIFLWPAMGLPMR